MLNRFKLLLLCCNCSLTITLLSINAAFSIVRCERSYSFPKKMTLTLWPLCSLIQSLMEKEQRLLVLQEADSVRQQELSSLRQDMQESQEGQKELSTQVLPMLPGAPFLGGGLLLECGRLLFRIIS